ncbi:MAG: hypothetical protein LN415_01420 [Candidatus Thermoplasmatota archaeon]|nr:hypothetical protein [Candidatus Thermoplasmatota archaeon]
MTGLMKVVMELPPEIYEHLSAVARAMEMSISQFVQVALENQFALEGLEVGERIGARSLARSREHALVDPWRGLRGSDIPWDSLKVEEEYHASSTVLWGQVNRLFPLKVSLRVLASLKERVPLKVFHIEATEAAVRVRMHLEALDRTNLIPRGERLAAGFPKNVDKSKRRFRNHFLCHLVRGRRPAGALAHLGFVALSREPETVSLTYPGMDFARLKNPMLEAPSTEVFSGEEIDFLLEYFEHEVKGEYELYRRMARWIASGEDTPDRLTAKMLVGSSKSVKVVNTMRAGALGRMQELGLVRRERDGRRVRYHVRERGERLLG